MDDAKTRTPKRVKVALAISLAINVLVVGAIVGAILHGGDRDRSSFDKRGGDTAAIGIYGRALEKPDRRAIGQRLRDGRAARGQEIQIRAELGEMVREASDLLKQTPFDKGAFFDVLLRQQGLIKGRSDAMQDALVEQIAAMSPEQRAEYAERLEELLERGGRRGKPDRE
ncbi:periplasmic heavy metal sensor [Litoreibacter halocynthiae]|uniref:periplasmic heavy metal sensor n=1 Tax=Litoreibacter halocynthiae TaxID=1242689 RepID=UPI0024907810|nr:periplasmic heavy metal sensor [Litoreibacter halocynthiae]